MHKISDEFQFWPDRTTDYGVSCPGGLEMRFDLGTLDSGERLLPFRLLVFLLFGFYGLSRLFFLSFYTYCYTLSTIMRKCTLYTDESLQVLFVLEFYGPVNNEVMSSQKAYK